MSERRNGRQIMWDCICSCGKRGVVSGAALTRGGSQSCGCIRSEKTAARGRRRLIDIAGKTFGSLTAIEPIGKVGKRVLWLCRCSCGAEKVLSSGHLRNRAGTVLTCRPKGTHASEIGFRYVASNYRSRALSSGTEWSLTHEEAVALAQQPCYYCGRSFVNQYTNAGTRYRYNGIDRIDSDKGYVAGNVRTCCGPCNIAKNAMSEEYFFALVAAISRNHPEIYELRLDNRTWHFNSLPGGKKEDNGNDA